jgi:RhtB (resistance to homoserine/threonine) family protein
VTAASLPVHDLPLFVAAALVLNLTPGPDMVFVLASGASRGRRAGVLAALGIGAGCLVHVALAALGLSALLATSALAFSIVKWLGAAYLVWMGVAMLRARPAAAVAATAAQTDASGARVFWQGALTNVLNPKVALFFLAFLPQFIAPGAAGQALAFLALGLLFTVGGTLVNIGAALLSAAISRRLASRGPGPLAVWLQRVVGALFVGLGVKLALASR